LRLDAFRKLCGDDAPVAFGDFRIQGGEQALRDLMRMDRNITALACASDEMAIGAMKAARQMGIRVPTDLSVVGFDDENSAQLVQPTLTTYAQPVEEMTRAAVKGILSEIETSLPVRGSNIPGRLIIRESTDRPKRD
jgi:LacI family repressor for deo operon, udp, cdd, tsx, nupC, and nupG